MVSQGLKGESDCMKKRQRQSEREREKGCTLGRRWDFSKFIMDLSPGVLILCSLLCTGNESDFILTATN